MDKKTYEALKRVMEQYKKKCPISLLADVDQIEGWIDEIAKEYTD